MHYWGYVMERLLTGDPDRATRRSRDSRRGQRVARGDRAWSRTAPWQ
jgi:hypothetical protein